MHHVLFAMFPNPLPMLLLLPFCLWLAMKYPRDKRVEALLLMSLAIVPISLVVINMIGKLTVLAPLKYDQYFYVMDMRLGDPSYRLGLYLSTHPAVYGVILNVYNLLPYELVVVFGMHLWKGTMGDALRAAWANFLLYAIIPFLYLVFPAVGPGIAFAGFPFTHPAITTPHLMIAVGPPNCMPSGHFAMSLLTIWLARKWRWGIVFASLFAAGTALATLGLGEHYVIDLIAAVPYTFLIIWLVEPKSQAHQVTQPDLGLAAAD